MDKLVSNLPAETMERVDIERSKTNIERRELHAKLFIMLKEETKEGMAWKIRSALLQMLQGG